MPTTTQFGSLVMRAALFIGPILTLLYFMWQIKKKQMQIDFAVSWCLFCFVIMFFGFFPGVTNWISQQLGFMSPINMVYLLIIFILLLKQFAMSIKLSKMNTQITQLTQAMAIKDNEQSKK